MGLLDKILSLDSIQEIFSPDIDSVMGDLESNESGLDFPSILFSRLAGELRIQKGALLLPDEEERFVPWSVTGFDETTSRRIRIPEEIIAPLKENSTYTSLELKGSEVDLMKDFFSFREYSVTERVIISPIKSRGFLVALIFISAGEIFNLENEKRRDILRQISDKAGSLLKIHRDKTINRFEGITLSADETLTKIARFMERCGGKHFIIIRTDVRHYIDLIARKEAGSIRFRIAQDILRLVKTLIGDKGEVQNRETGLFLILIREGRGEEAELLVHQIGLSLGYFFKIDVKSLKPEYTIISYPGDGKTAAELTEKL